MTVRLLWWLLWLPLTALTEERQSQLGYLYIVAAEGNASGGHVAVQFDDAVYHFQHHDGGLIRLHRDSVRDFEYRYRFLENRDIHASWLTVAPDAFARLRERFESRYQIQRLQFGLAGLLAQEAVWLTAMAGGQPVPLDLAGAGLFFDALAGADRPPPVREPVLARLARNLGTAVLDARIRAVETALRQLRPVAWEAARFVSDDPDFVPPAPYAFSERYQDLLTLRLALQALRQARPLRPGVLQTPIAAAFRLTPGVRTALCGFHAALEERIARLVRASQPDSGAALAILLARLIAVSRSCDSGYLAFLDRFEPDAQALAPERVNPDPAFWRPLLQRERAHLVSVLERLTDGGVDGVRYAGLEVAANRYHELSRALVSGTPIRLFGIGALPDRPLRAPLVVTMAVPSSQLRHRLEEVRRAHRHWRSSLRQLYRYDLLSRNCVTEALRTLGVKVRMARGDFIPFRSALAVARHYPVRERRLLLSYRHGRLRQRYHEAPAWRVYLQEFNTLTSTLYRPNGEDSAFLFFTDDVFWSRPLYGGINIGVDLALAGAGLMTLPFDRGSLLQRSVRGLFSGLVELGFGNIRKGSYLYLPPEPPLLSSP
ncbi:hypothetical protein MIN45_P2084 [Methylomarinovum tepidoasis]|uniref:DUF4105 domain-containing protein n=1 Tax=Methylomarinovum tepidoasis TaxID=2840183 RepID=A0AAU9CCT2_9GAMM|nr:hypothetical protein [Methylomarinovum sp. IN45]BCX89711.1 hypothetical protein MIN45_P2084 [Methylomarinovum sp. IN45]